SDDVPGRVEVLLDSPQPAGAGRHPRACDLGGLVREDVEVDRLRSSLGGLPAVLAEPLDRLHAADDDLLHLDDALFDLGSVAAIDGTLDELQMERERIEEVLEIVRHT